MPNQDPRHEAPAVRRTSFRQGATSWLDDLIFRFRARKVLAALPRPAPSLPVADLGSGYDARFLRLARQARLIDAGIAVDVSFDRSNLGEGIVPVEADLSDPLPIADGAVAAATSLAVLEHLVRPEVHLAEMHRILRPGGVAILTTPSRASKPVLEFLAYRLHVIDAAEIRDHKHYYSAAELRTLFEAAGFAPGVSHRSFALGMNQLVVGRKAPSPDAELRGTDGR
jgi:SAM-dependent methyltransferase